MQFHCEIGHTERLILSVTKNLIPSEYRSYREMQIGGLCKKATRWLMSFHSKWSLIELRLIGFFTKAN